jgi:diguanylate cyclase (GGDEF)-like protein/PAS domain S-box-containing protein
MNARRITALFLAFGIGWILLSDRAVDVLFPDAESRASVQSIKGIVFVLLSAVLVYLLVRMGERRHAAVEAQAKGERDSLAQVLDINPTVIYALKPAADGRPVFEVELVSSNVEKVTGFTRSQWMGTPNFWASHVHPDDATGALAAQERLMQTGQLSHEYRFRHANGSYRWIHDDVVLQKNTIGQPIRMVGAWLDVTDRRLAEERSNVIAQVFESSQEGIFITDAHSRFLSVNRAFTHITGYGMDELEGQTPSVLRSDRQDKAFYRDMWQEISATGRWEGEIWNRRKNGDIYPEWLVISAITDAQQQPVQYLGIFSETSSRKDAEERIQRLVNYDSLTNLPNRALLFDRAKVAFAAASRNHTHATVMHLNVDHFRHINEAFGHEAGDAVLQVLAQRLVQHLKPGDTVSRLSGDDFIILLPHTNAQEASNIALRLMAAVQEPLDVAGEDLRITTSVGVAEFPENGEDLTHLAQAAETAVVQAKQEGRNTIRFFSAALHRQVQDAMALERDLQHAVERQQLVVHYQPQVNADTERVVGIEALVRWQHPERGLVPPALFIPVAEKAGLIRQIGDWVLNQALSDCATWSAQGLPAVPVAVNLSMAQFRDEHLCDTISDALARSGVPAQMLELELTESVAMEDSEFTIATIDSLKKLGVALSIDDFGTGYSSLSYLKRFDIDKLKIDQSFVHDLTVDADDEAIVGAVIQLAHSLGLKTIAEGVETRAQVAFLHGRGCDEFQGYLFSRPVPAAQLAALLAAQGD